MVSDAMRHLSGRSVKRRPVRASAGVTAPSVLTLRPLVAAEVVLPETAAFQDGFFELPKGEAVPRINR